MKSSSAARQIRIIGIGGAAAPQSSTEQALMIALAAAERAGAKVKLFGGASLVRLPHYLMPASRRSRQARRLVASIREADGVIIASPGYHGSVSGLLKNAIDYLEETARDERPYLDGLPVGLIATAYGWQAAASTLATLRAITHALRGWPTPLGGAFNCSGGVFKEGRCRDPDTQEKIELIGRQVHGFASQRMSGQAIPALAQPA